MSTKQTTFDIQKPGAERPRPRAGGDLSTTSKPPATISIRAYGDAKAAGALKASMRPGAKFAKVRRAPTDKTWREAVREAVRAHLPAEPLTGPLICTIEFIMQRPKSHFGTGRNSDKIRPSAPEYPISKKLDLDNLTKPVFDVFTQMRLWDDDTLVVRYFATKRFAEPRVERPGALITVERME